MPLSKAVVSFRSLLKTAFGIHFCGFVGATNIERQSKAFLYRYFLDYKRVPSRSSESARRRQLAAIDVEEVFTFLSERNYAPSVSPQLKTYTSRVWDALLEEIGQVFGRFNANRQTRQTYRLLRKRHVRTRDTIVSFNYDVIFERSLPSSQQWYYEGVDQTHQPQSLRILKPHGSINWEEIDGTIEATNVGFPDHPIVIAPTHLKFIGAGARQEGDAEIFGYLNQSRQISDVWSAMEREMLEAKAWVFIGYSFPSSDLYFSSVLRSTLAGRDANPYIAIVNPDAMAISQRIGNRFYIPQNRIRTFPNLQTFNQIKRSQMLSLFD